MRGNQVIAVEPSTPLEIPASIVTIIEVARVIAGRCIGDDAAVERVEVMLGVRRLKRGGLGRIGHCHHLILCPIGTGDVSEAVDRIDEGVAYGWLRRVGHLTAPPKLAESVVLECELGM